MNHVPILALRLDPYASRITTADRVAIATDMAAYVDQLLAGADEALRAIPRTPSGLIGIDVARKAVANAEATLTVPRPRTEHTPGRITHAANGSWAGPNDKEHDRG